jgi:hypothetical protein
MDLFFFTRVRHLTTLGTPYGFRPMGPLLEISTESANSLSDASAPGGAFRLLIDGAAELLGAFSLVRAIGTERGCAIRYE